MELIKRILNPVIRSIDVESRSVEFVISSEAVDSHETVFKAEGWDLARYAKNPIVSYQHDDFSSDPDMIIGTSEVRMEDGQLIARLTLENLEDDMNEIAEKVWRKIQKGTLRMASIFARPLDGRYGDRSLNEDPEIFYFTRSELYAWSVVTIGSNPDAQVRSESEIRFIEKHKPTIPVALKDDFDVRILSHN
jgi:phage head maturation protease